MPRSVAVAARDLTKRYRDLEAVRSISFDVPAETCFGFLGPNGAGKTTTMRMIACALPPTSGRLDVLGIPVTEHPRRVKSRMGVVPREDNLDEEITVLDNLLIHARYHGLKPKNARPTALELLEFMELIDKKDHEIRELSGGMKPRLIRFSGPAVMADLVNGMRFDLLASPDRIRAYSHTAPTRTVGLSRISPCRFPILVSYTPRTVKGMATAEKET